MPKNNICFAKKIFLSAALGITCCTVLANETPAAAPAADAENIDTVNNSEQSLLYLIPRMIDAVPTFLPV